MMSDRSIVVKQSNKDAKFKHSKPADPGTRRKKIVKNWFDMMSDSSTKVKQSARDPKFKGSKPADASTGSKKTNKKLVLNGEQQEHSGKTINPRY